MKTNTIHLYQIDAFTDKIFGGNPAAVCPLNDWLSDEILKKIAIENNLAETAFFVKLSKNRFHLRWFTPEFEIDLCGHATLASAYVIFEELKYQEEEIIFETQSGNLIVRKNLEYYELDLPSRPPQKSNLPQVISDALNIQPKEVWKSRDYMLVYDSEDDIKKIRPNTSILNQINLNPGGIIVTAKAQSKNIDFVSRFFTPQASVFEDPVTGSAHCTLSPFWSNRLNKTTLKALQISDRRGELICNINDDRVKIKGKAVKYLSGVIEI